MVVAEVEVAVNIVKFVIVLVALLIKIPSVVVRGFK